MADKTFEDCSTREVYDWYLRLVTSVNTMVGGDSLAAMMLERYLKPDMLPTGTFTIPDRFLNKLKNRTETISYLRDVYRPSFLSEIELPFSVKKGTPKYGGIAPRLAGKEDIEYKYINGKKCIYMYLEEETLEQYSLSGAFGLLARVAITEPSRYGTILNEQEKENLDFFVSLHKHGITSHVWLETIPLDPSPILGQQRGQPLQINKWRIKFARWENIVEDEYDFNPEVGFTLPNPDFGSKASYAIMSGTKMIDYRTLRHKYLEDFNTLGWAKKYKVTGTWLEEHEEIKGDTEIDISRFR